MQNQEFKIRYKKIKEIIEEVDPTGWGAKSEYDDIIFKLFSKNKEINNEDIFAENLTKILVEELGLEESDIKDACLDVAKKSLFLYPRGI